jgi:hypothetical protein
MAFHAPIALKATPPSMESASSCRILFPACQTAATAKDITSPITAIIYSYPTACRVQIKPTAISAMISTTPPVEPVPSSLKIATSIATYLPRMVLHVQAVF